MATTCSSSNGTVSDVGESVVNSLESPPTVHSIAGTELATPGNQAKEEHGNDIDASSSRTSTTGSYKIVFFPRCLSIQLDT